MVMKLALRWTEVMKALGPSEVHRKIYIIFSHGGMCLVYINFNEHFSIV